MKKNNEKGNVAAIVIGVFVLIAIGVVSVLYSKKGGDTQNGQADNNGGATQQVPAQNTGVTQKTSFGGENEGEGDDEGSKTPVTPTKTPVVSTTPPVDTTKKVSTYKDGTYTATGTYMSPGGQDSIGVTVTLSKDIITSVSLNLQPGDNTSSRFMNKFASGYQAYVLGKNISSVNLTVVSGSSLTPNGFNDALSKIKSQAKA
jgi:uncharacterized protein with FMN-binding domain